jgi:hypothetical protein
MPMDDGRFHIEIDGLDIFVAFVAFMRGDDEILRDMVARLAKSTDALSEAERADAITMQKEKNR